MEQIQLPGSELRSSRLGFGCWRIIAAGKAVEVTPEREDDARKAILAAYDSGYTLFDHALARAERGLAGQLIVEGEPNPDIFNGVVQPGMGH